MAVAGYRKKDYRRACSICGGAAWFSEMRYIGQNRWACDVDAPGLTAEQISRHNARVKPLVVKPHKHPLLRAEVPDYKLSEASFFNIAVQFGATHISVGYDGSQSWSRAVLTNQPFSAGAVGVYLAELIAEGERPSSWITRATSALRDVGNAILALQYGSPTGPSPSEANTSKLYGMILSSGTTTAQPWASSIMGVALLRCYALFGDTAYLDGATKLAYWLRSMQCLSNFGSFAYNGGFFSQLSTSKSASSTNSIQDACALWFLKEYADAVGASAQVGVAAGGDFATSNTATLQAMMTDARGFYAGGTTAGTPLLSTSPWSNYSPGAGTFSLDSSSYSGAGTIISTIAGLNRLAIGLRGLFAYEGYSATVAEIYEWLMDTASNPGSEPAAGASQATINAGIAGTFDPEVSLPLHLQVRDGSGNPVNMSGLFSLTSFGYDPAATGLLSPVRVASKRDMSTFKRAVTKARRSRLTINNQITTNPSATATALLATVNTGYGMQIDAPGTCTLSRSAFIAMAFRYAPKTYPNLKAG